MYFDEIKELQAHNREAIKLAKEVKQLQGIILTSTKALTDTIESSKLYLGIERIDLDLNIKSCERVKAKGVVLALIELINKHTPLNWIKDKTTPGSYYTLKFRYKKT